MHKANYLSTKRFYKQCNRKRRKPQKKWRHGAVLRPKTQEYQYPLTNKTRAFIRWGPPILKFKSEENKNWYYCPSCTTAWKVTREAYIIAVDEERDEKASGSLKDTIELTTNTLTTKVYICGAPEPNWSEKFLVTVRFEMCGLPTWRAIRHRIVEGKKFITVDTSK